MVCLITLDRLLVVRFPLHKHLHLSRRAALLASLLAWLVGFALALTQTLPPNRHWGFYRQTGICLPLPITRRQFPGHHYTFAIFVVFNFVLFVFIGLGQACLSRPPPQRAAALRDNAS